MVEQMLRIRRSNNNRRVSTQGIQKRTGDIVVRVGKPQKDQCLFGGLNGGQHVLRKRPGLANVKPAGALEVMSELTPTRH